MYFLVDGIYFPLVRACGVRCILVLATRVFGPKFRSIQLIGRELHLDTAGLHACICLFFYQHNRSCLVYNTVIHVTARHMFTYIKSSLPFFCLSPE
jgi:hypothetical protein